MLLPNQKWLNFDITIKLFDHDNNSFILLERKDCVTHLEILIDSISLGNNILKTSKSLGILSRLRHFVATDTLLSMYRYLILPYITYGIAVWGQAAQTNLDKLLILQKVLLVKFILLHTDFMRSRYSTSIISSCRTFNTASQFALLSMTFLRIHCRETFPTNFFIYHKCIAKILGFQRLVVSENKNIRVLTKHKFETSLHQLLLKQPLLIPSLTRSNIF